jgi:small subunit ribosomal protein S20
VPRIESAKKALRQSRRRATHNRAQRSRLRTALKHVRSATTRQAAEQAYAVAARLLDRAARTGIVHRNSAARQKSRLAKVVKGMPA